MLDGSPHGKGEHDQRYMTMPAMPGPGFVVVEPEFVFGGLEAVLDRPAMPFDFDQRLDRSPCRTPSAEIGEIAVGDMTSDQQASRPQGVAFIVELFTLEIGEFEIAPIMQSWSLGSSAGRQTPPAGWSLHFGYFFGRASKQLRLAPGCKPMVGAYAEHIALFGSA